ncbi:MULTISPECIES: right-handed parallel beta-helix repeat-containing protein [Pseudofrankia]|uniref:right-handed parallel beta-helix repeat-containing protein n=1 Tax=Pseudofrankia TaxID=2994363 RepID=UPI0002F1F8E4|nr:MULTISPECIES: right-handed parallel beta-helix repeat-containing protein [Pseudofrankia]OHV39876.1 hypothetical protein BCD49_09775 [Pseudofrankia sp. EUN1h]
MPGAAGYPAPAGAVFAAPAGSDDAPGTLEQPLRTVAAALAKAPPGGTVVLRGGDYRETVASVTKPVTIQPYQREQAWLNGADIVKDWAPLPDGWATATFRSTLCRTCYYEKAVDPARPLAGSPNQVFVNGKALKEVAGDAQLDSGSFYVMDDGTVVIGTDPAGVTVQISVRWKAIQFDGGASGSVVRGIGVRGYAPVWIESQQLAAVILNAPGVRFTGNVLTDVAGTALAVTRPGAVVTGNVVIRNGLRGMVANRADGLVVTGNRFDLNNTAGFATTTCGAVCVIAGLKITRTRGLTVKGNSFSNNDGAGVWCDLGCIDATVTGNLVSGNTGNGMFYELSTNAVFDGNTITRNGRGLKIAGSDRVTVNGNHFTDNGIDLGVYDDPRSPSVEKYSEQNGLTWDTRQVTVTGNSFVGAGGTDDVLLETNRTAQVTAPDMIGRFVSNTFQPAAGGRVYWCSSSCMYFPTVTAFLASGALG